MKSEPVDPNSPPAKAGANSNPNFMGIDDLLLRPSAKSLDARDQADSQSSPRISLERFQELEQCIRNEPVDSEPYEELAKIYLSQDRWKDARRVLDAGIKHNPTSESLLVMREETSLQLSRQQLEAAKQLVAAKKSPENEQNLQRAELDLANLRLVVCEARMARHPEQLELVINCAIALRQLGRIPEAAAKLKTIQDVPEMRARACLQLGMCYQQLGRVTDALGAYRKAALYRAPSAPPEIKSRCLELAADLAEQSGLNHAALQYLQLWFELPGVNAKLIQRRIAKIKEAGL